MKTIWNGIGEVQPGEAYYTTDDGRIQGHPYVRDRAIRYLARWHRMFPLAVRKATIANTINDDAWMSARNECTVASLCRDAENWMLDHPTLETSI